MAKIERLPSGSYRIRVSVGKIDGKYRYASVTAPTRKDALAKAAEIQFSEDKLPPEQITLQEAYRRYIDSREEVLSPATVREYRRSAKNDFVGILDRNVYKLTQEQIQTAISQFSASHSPKSVRNSYGLLISVIKQIRPGFIPKIKLPQKVKNELYIPTDNEIKSILNCAKGKDIEIGVLLAAFGPLRRSEICALTDKDFTGHSVIVNKALVRNAYGSWELKVPKTVNGYREVELPSFVCDKLKGIQGSLFPMTPNEFSHAFSDLAKEAGVENIHLHTLRHWCISYLYSEGFLPKYIQTRSGQDIQTLQQIYLHTIKDKEDRFNQEANKTFEKLL